MTSIFGLGVILGIVIGFSLSLLLDWANAVLRRREETAWQKERQRQAAIDRQHAPTPRRVTREEMIALLQGERQVSYQTVEGKA